MLFLISFLYISASCQQFYNVTTSSGQVRGKQLVSYGNQTGYSFLGIPFATPPLGNLRYKAPIAPVPWNGTLEAFKYRDSCLQTKQPLRGVGQPSSEDCLYLNVFSSKACLSKGACPVLVFIHGGATMAGGAGRFDPAAFINNFANEERNIVAVTVQYRLGSIGWLNLNPDVRHSADSNVPVRDVLFALRWVQREIDHFGGNSSRVTAMGQSSGGELIHMIHLSGWSTGLFQQMIIMSAPVYGERTKFVSSKYSKRFAQKIGCADGNEQFDTEASLDRIVDCLRSKSKEEMIATQGSFRDDVEVLNGAWVDGSEGILPHSYEDGFKRDLPSIPCIIGTTTGEFSDTVQLVDDKTQLVKPDLLDEICTNVGYERNYERPEAFRQICNEYYSNASRAVKFNDDQNFYWTSCVFASHYSRFSPVFVYSYEYVDLKPPPNAPASKRRGPGHSTDLAYLIGRTHFPFKQKDRQVEAVHSGLFASFVKTGNPSYLETDWMPWNSERRNYMKIDFDEDLKLAGMSDGYYSHLHELIDVRIAREAGKRRPLPSLPEKIDVYMEPSLVNSITLARRSSPISMERRAIWEAHVNELKSLFSNPLSSSAWFMIVTGTFLAVIMVYVLFKAFYEWRIRRGYESICGEEVQ